MLRPAVSPIWRSLRLLAGLLLVAAIPRVGVAQVISSNIGVSLGATKLAGLSVTVLSGSVQSISTLTDGAINSFPSPVQIQTTWDLNPGKTGSVELVAYFTDPTAALSAGGANRLASSLMEGQMTTGIPTAFTAFTGTPVGGVGTSGATLRLFSSTITGVNKTATRTDNLNLRLNLTGQPNLPIGTFTGTLYIRAVTL